MKWILAPVQIGSNVFEDRLLNIDLYSEVRPFESGLKSLFIRTNGSIVLTEGVIEPINLIVNVPFETVSMQLKQLTAGFDLMGNQL